MVLKAIYVVLSIFVMIGVGMLLYHIGWVKDEHQALFSKLVTRVALPAMIISKLFTQYTRQSLIESGPGIVAPMLSLVLTGAVGLGLAYLTKVGERRRGAFTCMFTFSNSVFIGLPVSIALFGEGVAPITLLYYIANTVLFWSAGHYLISRDGGKGRLNIRNMFPLPLLVFISCCILVLLGVQMPVFILDAAKYVGDMVTPLSLIYTGMLIMAMLKARMFRWEKGYGLILCGRFLFAPAMLLLVSRFIHIPELMRNALLIQSAMPVMSQTPIVCGAAGSDAKYAAGGIAVTTLGSLVSIPLYMWLITYL